MEDAAVVIRWILVIIALTTYLFSMGFVIFKPTTPLPAPLENLETGLSAILLTNLGGLLGVSIDGNSGLSGLLGFSNTTISLTPTEIMQLVSSILYLIILLVCAIQWIYDSVKPQKPPIKLNPLIIQNGKIFFAVLIAVSTVFFSIPSKPPQTTNSGNGTNTQTPIK